MALTSDSSPQYAFATLLTSDHYLPGALVLAQSIRLAHGISRKGKRKVLAHTSQHPFETVALITPDTLSVQSVKALCLSGVFDWIVGVEPISFKQIFATQINKPGATNQELHPNDLIRQMEKNLNLLGRPDLVNTLTKLHAWRLGKDSAHLVQASFSSIHSQQGTRKWNGFEKVIFLDADMLVLRPIDHLFNLPGNPHFAASPDTGWPDAFNSGLMVLKPCGSTFEAIRTFARERASWDGADQGLLNDFFGSENDDSVPEQSQQAPSPSAPGGGWKRLSFRYNVTSHGGYTFAPAYQRYGSSIMAAHFIGQHKPWNRPRPHGRAQPNPHSTSPPPPHHHAPIRSDQPDYLLALWHDTYASLYPPDDSPVGDIEIIHTSRGVQVVEKRVFTVPTHRAVWDAEDRIKRYQDSVDPEPSSEADYVSLPLDGRTNLIAPQLKVPSPPTTSPSHDLQHQKSNINVPLQSQSQPHQHPKHIPIRSDQGIAVNDSSDDSGLDSPKHFSPAHLVWNPAMAPPPSGKDASHFQMRNPPETYYQNVWDEPSRAPRTVPEQKAAFSVPTRTTLQAQGGRPISGPGYIPSKLRRDQIYENLGNDRPDWKKIKPIFPWEQPRDDGRMRPPPSRVFPDEPRTAYVKQQVSDSAQLRRRQQQERNRTAATNWQELPSNFIASVSSPPPIVQRGLPANLSYTNAWDEENAIGDFANWWTQTNSRSKYDGREIRVQATPNIRHRSSQTGMGGHQSGGNESVSVTTSYGVVVVSVGGVSTNGYDAIVAEGDAHSDSRDGDDESSSDGEDSSNDENVISSDSRRRSPPSWQREGKGYQRKVENSAWAHINATPRSPRHMNPNSSSPPNTQQSYRNPTSESIQLLNSSTSLLDLYTPSLTEINSASQRVKDRIRPENWLSRKSQPSISPTNVIGLCETLSSSSSSFSSSTTLTATGLPVRIPRSN